VAASATNAPLRELGPGLFQLGDIRLDKKERTVSFPAVVNLTESPVEYLVVTTYGKIHESILRTEVPPYQIHLAMLLLGAKPGGVEAFPEDPAKPIPGEPLTITLHWKSSEGESRHATGEAVVKDVANQKPLADPRWTYNGSHLFQGTFLAQQEGSIISLYADPVALINQSGPHRDNDDNWLPLATSLPPEETLVEVVLQLTARPAAAP